MKIKAEWDGARVKLRPASFLGPGLFELYRASASPAVYTPALKCQIATIDQFLEVEEGLEFAGFLVERTDALQEALDGLDEERAMESAALDVRMLKIDAGLAERGLSLYPYQREGAKFLALRQNALLADDMGCLAGDTPLYVSFKGHPVRSLTIRGLYGLLARADIMTEVTVHSMERQEGAGGVGSPLSLRGVVRVLDQGQKRVVRVKTRGGFSVTVTPDHKFATPRGWAEAKDLLGRHVLVQKPSHGRSPQIETVTEVEDAGETDVYDIVMEGPYHNFVAGGFVVHNCGKTIQVLAALPDEPRVLVVCPAVVRSVWLQEVARFRPDLRIRTIQERKDAGAMLPEPGEVVAISYDLLPESPVDLTGIVLVADEAHALKGNKSLRTKRFRRLSDTASRVWLLTATPLANRPEELFSVLQAGRLHLQAFTSYEKYLSLYGAKKGRFGMIWPEADKIASPEVRERLDRVMLRRTKAEVLPQLPEKRFRVITVDLASALSRACDDALAELEDMGESLMDSDLEERLPFELLAGLRRKLSIAKFPVLEDLVTEYEAQNEPPVVFSVHRFAIDKLAQREGWRKVTGDETDEERAEAVRLYQADELKGIALTIKAGGVGLTLTRGAHALYLDQSFVPAENAQSQDRILRLGQTRGVLITRLVANHPIDLRVDEILRKKTRIIEATLRRRGVETFEELADLPPEAGAKKKRRKAVKKTA